VDPSGHRILADAAGRAGGPYREPRTEVQSALAKRRASPVPNARRAPRRGGWWTGPSLPGRGPVRWPRDETAPWPVGCKSRP